MASKAGKLIADPNERALLEALLERVNTPEVVPSIWRDMLRNFAVSPEGALMFEPQWYVNTPDTEIVRSIAERRDWFVAQLERIATSPRTAQAELADEVNALMGKLPLALAMRLPAHGPAIHTACAGSIDTFVGLALVLLLDPARPFGIALRRCSFEGIAKQHPAESVPRCRDWFLRLSPGGKKGGKPPRYCAKREEHKAQINAATGPNRTRESRKRRKDGVPSRAKRKN